MSNNFKTFMFVMLAVFCMLNFSISAVSAEQFDEPKEGDIDEYRGPGVLRGAGGPDLYGYSWIDSNEDGGPAFDYIDISATGTPVVGMPDDGYLGPFDIGFTFNFYGVDYTQFYIQSNGAINFAAQYMTLSNTNIPNASSPNGFLAWCWDDLNPTDPDNESFIYYENMGDMLVIQFVDYTEYGGGVGEVINAEVILYADGTIKYQYDSIGADFDILGCTVGIENQDGTDGLQVAYNEAYLEDNLAVMFSTDSGEFSGFFDDFENGTGNWILDSPWGLTDASAHSGTYSLTDSPGGNYPTYMDVYATMANPIDLSGVEAATLNFYAWYNTESCCDYAEVQVSTDGTSWISLQEFGGSSYDWTLYEYNLADYVGSSQFWVRFYFYSDYSVNYDGFYVDDVSVAEPSEPFGFFDDFENGTDNWVLDSPWGLTDASAYSGMYSLTDSPGGNYAIDMDIYATLAEPIDLSGVEAAMLNFYAWYNTESCCDYAQVQVSTDGTSWTSLQEFRGSSYDWTLYEYDLADYIGAPEFWVRFYFHSDFSVNYDGFYVDDVTIAEAEPQIGDDYEPNNTMDEASPVDINSMHDVSIDPEDDVDWFVFDGMMGESVRIFTERINESQLDPEMYLYHMDGGEPTILANNDDNSSYGDSFDLPNLPEFVLQPALEVELPADGEYWVRIAYFINDPDYVEGDDRGKDGSLRASTGEYRIYFYDDLHEPNDVHERGTVMVMDEMEETMDADINPAGDIDWYTFYANAGQTYLMYTERIGDSQIDPEFFLYYYDPDIADLVYLTTNDDSHGDLQPEIEYTFETDGNYYLRTAYYANNPESIGEINKSKRADIRATTGDYRLFMIDLSLEPPDLMVSVVNDIVHLNWNAIEDTTLLGYNVYRDGILLNTELITETNYMDLPGTGSWCYTATAMYEAGESNPSDESCVSVTLGTPGYLTAEAIDNTDVLLNWTGTSDPDILWDQLDPVESVMRKSAQDFEEAYDIYDAEVCGDFVLDEAATITGFKTMGTYSGTPTELFPFNIAIYADDDGEPVEEAMYTSQTTSATLDANNVWSVSLIDPITLESGTYWIGYQIRMDYALYGQGFMQQRSILENYTPAYWRNPGDGFGTGYTTWSLAVLDPTETIAEDLAFQIVGESGGAAAAAVRDGRIGNRGLAQKDVPTKTTVLNAKPMPNDNIVLDTVGRPFEGDLSIYLRTPAMVWSYNVYRQLQGDVEWTLLAENVTETTYTDLAPEPNPYCYQVTTVHDVGESDPSNTACARVYEVDEYEPNDVIEDAASIYVNTWTDAMITPPGDVDWFRFNTEGGQTFRIFTERINESQLDTEIYLYYMVDGELVLLANNDDAGYGENSFPLPFMPQYSLQSGIEIELPVQGNYWLRVAYWMNDPMGVEEDNRSKQAGLRADWGDYRLHIVDDLLEPNEEWMYGTPMVIGESMDAGIYPSQDEDWYYFSGMAGDDVLMYTELINDSQLDPEFYFYQVMGDTLALLANDDDSRGDLQPEITHVLPVDGDYALRVSYYLNDPDAIEGNDRGKQSVLRARTGDYRLFIVPNRSMMMVTPTQFSRALLEEGNSYAPMTFVNDGYSELDISMAIEQEWITVSESEFTVPPLSSHMVWVAMYATEPGNHTGSIEITSNDPEMENVTVPVSVTVYDDCETTSFAVRIENISEGSSLPTGLSPGAWAIHSNAFPFFQPGYPASDGLEELAEYGNPQPLLGEVADDPGVMSVGVTGDGPIGLGEQHNFIVDACPGARLSFATMFGISNDRFYAPCSDGIELFDEYGTPQGGEIMVFLWDAGTEVNEWPLPPADHPDGGVDEDGVVMRVMDGADGFPPVDEVIRVRIKFEFDVEGTAEYRTNRIENPRGVPGVELQLGEWQTTTGNAGQYRFRNLPLGDYDLMPAFDGDVNGISVFDAAAVLRYEIGILEFDEYQMMAADVTNNGQVTSYDAAWIARFAAGLPPNPNHLTGSWMVMPSYYEYEPLMWDMSDQDFGVLLYGEVTGNWAPPVALAENGKSETSSVLTSPVELLITGSNAVLKATEANDVYAFQFVVESKDAIEVNLAKSVPSDWELLVTQRDDNTWFVGGYGATPLADDQLIEMAGNHQINIQSGLINEMAADIEKTVITPAVPSIFGLSQNYPNPFNPTTAIGYQLPAASDVSLTIYDVSGKLVKTWSYQDQVAGQYTIEWNGTDHDGNAVASGIYFYRLEAGDFTQTRQMTLLK